MVATGMDLPVKPPAPAKYSDAPPPPVNPGDDILGFRKENTEKGNKKQLKGCVFVGTHERKRKREKVCVLVMLCGVVLLMGLK